LSRGRSSPASRFYEADGPKGRSEKAFMHGKRRPLIAGNWKMFKGGPAGLELAHACVQLAAGLHHVEMVIAPPFTVLAAAAAECDGSGVALAGQNVHAKSEGAFTGEVSATMLVESGCTWVIIGHSERRQHFGESDALVADKVRAAFDSALTPIICVGETLGEREAGRTLEVIRRQVGAIAPLLARRPAAEAPRAAIAYEPVWAIGTGKNAGPEEAEEVHLAIRTWLHEQDAALAHETRILYGGSVKPENAASLLACPNVDGALIGGASLDAASFGAIARAAEVLAHASH
jgi:triosephosphate isomerase